tara:strand:- start:338 stop:748 length:411 start_codon:yes stop_codon:yes gene_type:complete
VVSQRETNPFNLTTGVKKMATHRSPQELLRAHEEKTRALKLRVAQSIVASNPEMKILSIIETNIKKDLTKAVKWLDPEKGLTARIAKLERMITEATVNLANATDTQNALRAQLAENLEEQKKLAESLDLDSLIADM